MSVWSISCATLGKELLWWAILSLRLWPKSRKILIYIGCCSWYPYAIEFLWFVQDLLGIGLPHAGLKCRSSLKFKCKACAEVRYVCDIRESCVLPPHLHIFKILWSVTVSRLLLYTEGRKHIFTYPLSFNSHYLLGVSSGALFCCAAFRYVCDIL